MRTANKGEEIVSVDRRPRDGGRLRAVRLRTSVRKEKAGWKQEIREGIRLGLPVLIGYFSASVPFGLLAKAGEVSPVATFFFSALVFAGASQFMALNLLQAGVAAGEIILATFLMNSRHLVMSTVLAARMQANGVENIPGKKMDKSPEDKLAGRPLKRFWLTFLAAFGVTDETFALAVTGERNLTPLFLIALEGTAYSGWITGTITGFLLGTALPAKAGASMGIALYAMFAAILVPEVKKSRAAFLLAAGAGIFHTLLGRLQFLSPGWNLILAILLTAAAGSFFCREKREE